MTLTSLFAKTLAPVYVNGVMYPNQLWQSFLPFKNAAGSLIRRHFLPREGVVLDIGANIGRFTGMAAAAVGAGGRVYSFEPVPLASRVLKTMVVLKRLGQVRVVEAALSDSSGTAEIHIPLKWGWKPQTPTAHIAPLPRKGAMHRTVRIQRLDDFCRQQGVDRIDFIKCDTEGHEHAVFSGGVEILSRCHPAIFCEINDRYLARQRLTPAAVFGLLGRQGYRALVRAPGDTLSPVDGYVTAGDYFFLHQSRMQSGHHYPIA